MLYIFNDEGRVIGFMQGDLPVYYTAPLPASVSEWIGAS